MGWDTAGYYQIAGSVGGAGSLRNVVLSADGSATQVVSDTAGTVDVANDFTVDTDVLVVDSVAAVALP